MARVPIVIGGMAVLLVALGGVYRLTHAVGRTPEGDLLLTAIPNTAGFAPAHLPDAPVLVAKPGPDLAVDFGYRVAGASYAYSLVLRFPADADTGSATVTARHAGQAVSREGPTLRLWDAPREAYMVAVTDRFDMNPAVPALCLKVLIGPDRARYDLKGASLCVAQLDGAGNCHPETLACGRIRSPS